MTTTLSNSSVIEHAFQQRNPSAELWKLSVELAKRASWLPLEMNVFLDIAFFFNRGDATEMQDCYYEKRSEISFKGTTLSSLGFISGQILAIKIQSIRYF